MDATWTTAVGSTAPVASTTYTIETRSTNAVQAIIAYVLTITDGATPLLPAPPTPITSPPVDMLRSAEIYRGVYLNKDGTLTASHPLGTNLITLYSQVTNQVLTTPITTYTDSGTTRTYTLVKGYYAFKFGGTTAATITYQSDPYTCPQFINLVVDVNTIFEPCHLITYTDTAPFSGSSPNWINTFPRF